MAQTVALTFINDQDFFLAIDVSGWMAYYPDLGSGTFRMQARTALGVNAVAYAWSSDPDDGVAGVIELNSGAQLLLITAPYSDMRQLAAQDYAYGLQYERDVPMTRFLVEDVWVGTLTVNQGCVYT